MATAFRVRTHNNMPATAGTPETLFTVDGSTEAIVILGLVLANVHTSQVTASVVLSSNHTPTGAPSANTDAFLVKDVAIPAGASLSVIDGKVIAEDTDIIKIDCSVADKVSVTLSYMEIT